jgi:hypothetical protein
MSWVAMKSTLGRLVILVLIPLLSGGGPAVGSVRTLLTQPNQTSPINDEEEHRGKDHGCRTAAVDRRVITHQQRAAHSVCILPGRHAETSWPQTSSAPHATHSSTDLRNGIGAPLRI